MGERIGKHRWWRFHVGVFAFMAVLAAAFWMPVISAAAYAAGALPARPAMPAVASSAVPDLYLLTSLPLFWGEGGLARVSARPALMGALEKQFAVHPVDDLLAPDALPATQAGGVPIVLLIIQPRRLAPAELVALDRWVRSGGRVLLFADPDLRWPSRYPPGDPRRPIPVTLIDPWLSHLGLALGDADGRTRFWTVKSGVIESDSAGQVSVRAATGVVCRASGALVADCAVGFGRLIVIGDADLLADARWRAARPVAPLWLGQMVGAVMAGNPVEVPVEKPPETRVAGFAAWFMGMGGVAALGFLWLVWRWFQTKRDLEVNK